MSEINFRWSGEGHQTQTEEIAPCRSEPAQQLFMRARSVISRVVSRVSGEEILVVPERAKVGNLASIYSLKGTGAWIWQWLDVPRTLPELVGAIEREFGLRQEQAVRDVRQFLDEMLCAGLVQTHQPLALTAIEMSATEATGLWETAGSR